MPTATLRCCARRTSHSSATGARPCPRSSTRSVPKPSMLLQLHEWGARHAPPVVCLHGVTGHGRRFRRLAEERLAPSFRVLAPDLRGHGHSDWEPPWTLRANLADVLETVAAAGVERAT